MLPAGNRLRRAPDFALAVRGGRRAGRGALVLHLRPAVEPVTDLPAPARIGLVVGRALGPAVTRNRVKRRLRALLRDRLTLLPPGSLLVVRALPAAADASSVALAADLDAGLRRLLPDRVRP